MASREDILARIRAAKPQSVDLPVVDRFESEYQDPVQKFRDVLAAIGGEAVDLDGYAGLREILDLKFPSMLRKASAIPELANWADFSLNVEDPHALETVNLVVLQAETGVAENAAIWISDRHVAQRVLPFITQYLVIVLPKSGIVNNMHDAFEKIGAVTEGWGAFIAGPSKTADIEQSLVIGAHGARGLTVILT